jgi:hypothetical protein
LSFLDPDAQRATFVSGQLCRRLQRTLLRKTAGVVGGPAEKENAMALTSWDLKTMSSKKLIRLRDDTRLTDEESSLVIEEMTRRWKPERDDVIGRMAGLRE